MCWADWRARLQGGFNMSIDPTTLVTILGMSFVAIMARTAGFWLFANVTPSPRFESALKYMTPAILISIVVPEIVKGGMATWLAGLATIAVAVLTRQLLLALIAGVAVAALVRLVLV